MYEVVVSVDRTVTEQYKVTVKADDPEEAQDIVYDYFTSFPSGTVTPETLLKIKEDTVSITVNSIEFERKKEIADKVFNDDDNDDPGPRYA